jgi:hypothetical protein
LARIHFVGFRKRGEIFLHGVAVLLDPIAQADVEAEVANHVTAAHDLEGAEDVFRATQCPQNVVRNLSGFGVSNNYS